MRRDRYTAGVGRNRRYSNNYYYLRPDSSIIDSGWFRDANPPSIVVIDNIPDTSDPAIGNKNDDGDTSRFNFLPMLNGPFQIKMIQVNVYAKKVAGNDDPLLDLNISGVSVINNVAMGLTASDAWHVYEVTGLFHRSDFNPKATAAGTPSISPFVRINLGVQSGNTSIYALYLKLFGV